MWRNQSLVVLKGGRNPPRNRDAQDERIQQVHQHPVSIKVELLHHSMSGITLQ